MNVLVLEDDEELAVFVRDGLLELGHSVHSVENGQEALTALLGDRFDVAVLDRLVPGLDGLSVVKQARQAGCQTPMLLLTALGGIEERVVGLESGADDYLIKPFAFTELVARVVALGRRPPNILVHDQLVVGDIEVNLSRRTVTREGRPIDLQPREFSLLEQLMRSPDRIVTRAMLLDRVWNFGFDPQTNIVETHMSRLRTKLNHGFDQDAIRTVRGSGYILRQPGD
jgi:two-component system OmpR family response regulator